jgi:hypothetical protein
MIAIITPTLNRPEHLARLKTSLRLYAHGLRHIVSEETVPRSAPDVVNGMLREAFADPSVRAVCYLADYCEVHEHFGDKLKSAFADSTSHMQGIRIANLEFIEGLREYCFWTIGREFYELFQNGEVFCPQYWHFSVDTELGEAAVALGRFKMDHGIKVSIHHPNARNADRDETHSASRAYAKFDSATRAARKAAGLLWGVSFHKVVMNTPWQAEKPVATAVEPAIAPVAAELPDELPDPPRERPTKRSRMPWQGQ